MDTDEVAGIYAREIDYLERYVQIGIASGRIISVSFPEYADDDAADEHDLLGRFERYCDGIEEDDFADVEVGLTMPTGERNVLETLRGVEYGEQVSVDQLAKMTPTLDSDDEQDVITVREALAENPLPVIFPDHRVRDGPSALPPQVEQRFRSLEDL